MIKHVVFVDDDPTQNMKIKKFCEKDLVFSNHIKVDFIEKAEYLIPVSKSINLDLVVLDYCLNSVSAKTIAAAIKSNQSDCPIWLYSGYNPKFLPKVDKLFFDAYYSKETSSEGLRKLLNDIKHQLIHRPVQIPVN